MCYERRGLFSKKVLCEAIFEVHNTGNDVEFDPVTLEFVAIAIRQDFKGFKLRKCMAPP